MPPKGRGKGKQKRHRSVTPPVAPSPQHDRATVESDEEQQTHETVDIEVQTKDEAATTPAMKKTRPVPLTLQPEQEQALADWYKENEFLYNFRMADYKNKEKRQRIMKEKAQQFGISAEQLTIWLKSIRDRAGKITKKQPSGSGAQPLTDRDKWVLDNFGYIQNYMRRVAEGKRKKGG
ncbi:uncharacterized protein LOC121368683 [Gigantopelta aegis]|uniref:uncharacterized protein LOC121368683 n=1 Tax=Gigantopelta aegis TaxID=1735272 RepID=UPI001B88A71C|nr:uncharacterized protein LOC121368683 [Gigantopelta aegis]